MGVRNGEGRPGLCVRILCAFADRGVLTKEQCADEVKSNDLASVGVWVNRLVEQDLLEEIRHANGRGGAARFRLHRRLSSAVII